MLRSSVPGYTGMTDNGIMRIHHYRVGRGELLGRVGQHPVSSVGCYGRVPKRRPVLRLDHFASLAAREMTSADSALVEVRP